MLVSMRRWWLLVLMMAALLCGCGGQGDGPADGRPDPARQQAARDALARYDRAVLAVGRRSFVPTGTLTGQVGAWADRAILDGTQGFSVPVTVEN